ncbi:hypothetical protein CERSUDRAFT_76346 [Gelatoporia subvermispora B]|uniref:Uncharacterized protein n=1 Tax=Ceriporiopsis subvermispora (strain B) TaxID=914234 RepID=M2QN60_CERS8|nr:hypothetical protein CERSUDRAFT_76346 [Gelatoporia subvermispora B]
MSVDRNISDYWDDDADPGRDRRQEKPRTAQARNLWRAALRTGRVLEERMLSLGSGVRMRNGGCAECNWTDGRGAWERRRDNEGRALNLDGSAAEFGSSQKCGKRLAAAGRDESTERRGSEKLNGMDRWLNGMAGNDRGGQVLVPERPSVLPQQHRAPPPWTPTRARRVLRTSSSSGRSQRTRAALLRTPPGCSQQWQAAGSEPLQGLRTVTRVGRAQRAFLWHARLVRVPARSHVASEPTMCTRMSKRRNTQSREHANRTRPTKSSGDHPDVVSAPVDFGLEPLVCKRKHCAGTIVQPSVFGVN